MVIYRTYFFLRFVSVIDWTSLQPQQLRIWLPGYLGIWGPSKCQLQPTCHEQKESTQNFIQPQGWWVGDDDSKNTNLFEKAINLAKSISSWWRKSLISHEIPVFCRFTGSSRKNRQFRHLRKKRWKKRVGKWMVHRYFARFLVQGGPLPLMNRVITPIDGLATGFAWGYSPACRSFRYISTYIW